MTSPAHVLLVGFMGSGKSSVGRALATRLGLAFIDLDERIEDEAKRTIPEIFATESEMLFRDRESAALAALVSEPSSVVACGGGVVLREENRAALRGLGVVVYLEVSPETSARRCGAGESRPLLAGRTGDEVTTLLTEREPLYAGVADVCVNTDRSTVAQVVDCVEEALRDRDAQCGASSDGFGRR